MCHWLAHSYARFVQGCLAWPSIMHPFLPPEGYGIPVQLVKSTCWWAMRGRQLTTYTMRSLNR